MTGSWTGTWQNDPQWGDANGGFTMELTQDETRFTGPIDITGPTCVHHGESAGTIANGHVSWGIVAAGARDVDFEGVLAGDELAGTWTMTACGTSLTISGSWAAER